MDFEKLVEIYEQLEKISSGNQIRELLADFFRKVPAEEIAIVSYLTLGKITAESEELVLGMADKSVLKAISVAGGIELNKVQKIMREKGDVGLTAAEVLRKKPRTLIPLGKLSVEELFNKLRQLVKTSGQGSQEVKTKIVATLLQKSTPIGAKYITRIVLGTLRMGVGEMAVLDALALAYTNDKKNKDILETAYNLCPDVGIIAETLAKQGLPGLIKIKIHVGRPIKMMLAQRVKSLAEVPEKIHGEMMIDAKYDGERVQAHKDAEGKIKLFSRRLDDITNQFPDLVENLAKLKAKEFIVEGEILAVNEKGKPLSFQILMKRRRKHEVQEYQKKIPVIVKLFDLLYFNGESYLQKKHAVRLKKLQEILPQNKKISYVDQIVTTEQKKIVEFFQKMLKKGYEGIIIKSPEGEYQAGIRGWNWIKWKKEYAQGLVDTFDLVVIGAFLGKGKRSGVYGALLCAVYNPKEDGFVSICKLGTGLTDETLQELPVKLKPFALKIKPVNVFVKKEMEPDLWFEPKLVVEVLAAEITKSPFHTAEFALRFPRFLKVRDDKEPEQATTVEEIKQLSSI